MFFAPKRPRAASWSNSWSPTPTRKASRDWKTLRRLLSTHGMVATVLPLRDGRVLRIRKPSLPGPEQALVSQNLGIPWKSAFPPLQSFKHP